MNVSNDKAVPESFHGVAEDIPADGLDDVFHEFRPVGFDALPFLCGTYAFIGDRFPTELIDPDPGLDIGQPPAGGKAADLTLTIRRPLSKKTPLIRGVFCNTLPAASWTKASASPARLP